MTRTLSILLVLLVGTSFAGLPVGSASWGKGKQVRATGYQPVQTVRNCGRSNAPHIDADTGGGPVGAWTGTRLEEWHAACALPRRSPVYSYGTVIYAGSPLNRYFIIVDCGGGVKSNQVDFCFIKATELRAFGRRQGELRRSWVNTWRVGKVTRSQARTWSYAQLIRQLNLPEFPE